MNIFTKQSQRDPHQQSLAVVASGVASAVGLTAPTTFAAIRAGIDGFEETRFRDFCGEPIIGAEVPLKLLEFTSEATSSRHASSTTRLAQLFELAVEECLQPVAANERLLTLVLLPSASQAGIPADIELLLDDACRRRDWGSDNERHIIRGGRTAVADALKRAQVRIVAEPDLHVLIVGVDSLMNPLAINGLLAAARLVADDEIDGFLPGEAASAILLRKATPGDLTIRACEITEEPTTVLDTEAKSRFTGLATAVGSVLKQAGIGMHDIGARLVSASGEEYFFEELAAVSLRHLREHRSVIPLWHPADCIGEVGTAVGPLLLAQALDAHERDYAPSRHWLVELSNDDGSRAAIVLEKTTKEGHA